MNLRLRIAPLIGLTLLGLVPSASGQTPASPDAPGTAPSWNTVGSDRRPAGIDWNAQTGTPGSIPRAPRSLAPSTPGYDSLPRQQQAQPQAQPQKIQPLAAARRERGGRQRPDGAAAKVVGRSAEIELARGEQRLLDADSLIRPAFEAGNEVLRQRYGGLRDDDILTTGAPLADGGDAAVRHGDAASAQRVSSALRGRGTAVIRAGDAAGITDSSRIQAPALVCARNGEQPQLRRLTPADGERLVPKGAFVIQGLCFGSAPGRVQVILPTAYGPIRTVEAQVVDWQAGKIFAVLPDVDRVIPGQATVEVIAAGGPRGRSAPLPFEPSWELRQRTLPATTGRIDGCAGGGYYSRCVMVFAGHQIDHRDPQFAAAATCRSSGLPGLLDPLQLSNAFVSCNDRQPDNLQGQVLAQHNSGGEDLRETLHRSDVYQLQLPPYARVAALRYQTRAFPGQGRIDAPRYDPASGQLEVRWAMIRDGAAEPGLIEYAIDFDTLWPRGVDR